MLLNRVYIRISLILWLLLISPCLSSDWDRYSSEATAAWKRLREHSTVISFDIIETSSIGGGPEEERVRRRAQANGEQLFLESIDSRDGVQRVGVAGIGYGLIVERKKSTDPWSIVRYGPNRKQVLDIGGRGFQIIQLQPLVASQKVTFEELVSAKGVEIESVADTGEGADRRVTVKLNIADDAIFEGEPIPIDWYVYEFAPEHHWVVTKLMYESSNSPGETTIEYQFDSDGWPLITLMTTRDTRSDPGKSSVGKHIYQSYKYECEDRVFDPATYGLPPLKPSAEPGSWSRVTIFSIVIAAVLVVGGLILRRRATS